MLAKLCCWTWGDPHVTPVKAVTLQPSVGFLHVCWAAVACFPYTVAGRLNDPSEFQLSLWVCRSPGPSARRYDPRLNMQNEVKDEKRCWHLARQFHS